MTRRELGLMMMAGAKAGGVARTISFEAGFYHGWPTLTRRKNGELLAVYSGGREAHVCPIGRVELMRSHDDGDTWSYAGVLMAPPLTIVTPESARLLLVRGLSRRSLLSLMRR